MALADLSPEQLAILKQQVLKSENLVKNASDEEKQRINRQAQERQEREIAANDDDVPYGASSNIIQFHNRNTPTSNSNVDIPVSTSPQSSNTVPNTNAPIQTSPQPNNTVPSMNVPTQTSPQPNNTVPNTNMPMQTSSQSGVSNSNTDIPVPARLQSQSLPSTNQHSSTIMTPDDLLRWSQQNNPASDFNWDDVPWDLDSDEVLLPQQPSLNDIAETLENNGGSISEDSANEFRNIRESYENAVGNEFTSLPNGYGDPVSNSYHPTEEELAEDTRNENTAFNVGAVGEADFYTGLISAAPDLLNRAFNALRYYTGSINREPVYYDQAETSQSERSKVEFRNCTVCIGDQPMQYTVVAETMTSSERQKLLYHFKEGDVSNNFDYLRHYITKQIIKKFGLDRITSIYVSDSELIINNMSYALEIALTEEEIMKYLPIDTRDLLLHRLYASFFVWSNLKRMPKLSTLYFSDMEFILNVVACDLNLDNSIGLVSFFKLIPSLQQLCIKGEVLTRDTINSDKSRGLKLGFLNLKRGNDLRQGAKHSRIVNIASRLTNGITRPTELTQEFQSAMKNNMTDYFHNKGDKGAIRYCCGVIVTGLIFGGAWAINTTTHLAGNGISMVGDKLQGESIDNANSVQPDNVTA